MIAIAMICSGEVYSAPSLMWAGTVKPSRPKESPRSAARISAAAGPVVTRKHAGSEERRLAMKASHSPTGTMPCAHALVIAIAMRCSGEVLRP